MTTFTETFCGYLMNEKGQWRDKVILSDAAATKEFLFNNVASTFELRITDGGDNLVLHVKQQELLFPLTGNQKPGNKWHDDIKMFVNEDDETEVILSKLMRK